MLEDDALTRFQMHGQDIPWLLALRAERTPEATALEWAPRDGAGRSWSYHELWQDVRGLAAGLTARGVTTGDRLLVHADNCPEMVLSWLACATLGAVAVTTNTKSVGPEVTYFAEQSGAVAAITQPRYAALVADAAPELAWVAVTEDDSGDPAEADPVPGAIPFDALRGDPDAWAGRPIEPMLPYAIMFTSGTTSRPKAVVHTHANAIWASRTGPRNIDLGPDDCYLIYLPFFHVNAQCWSFLAVLGVGARAVLVPKWSQSGFWPVVADHGVTHISLMPFTMTALGQLDRPATALRVGVFGLIMGALDDMFGIGVYAAYGMTETVTHAILGKPTEGWPDRSMGHPSPGYEIAVVDPDTGELCGEDQTGELWLRGTRGIQLFLEYAGNPEANAKAFEHGWFRTGDMVKVGAGGNVYYQERDKDVLKVGGENVSAREVEQLISDVAGVQAVAVVAKAHDFLSMVPVAFVITDDGADEERLTADILETCREQLSSFKVPRAVYYVDAFPTGTLDKLLKNELRDLADQQPPIG